MKRVLIINSPVFDEQNMKNCEDYLPPIGLGIIYTNISYLAEVQFIDSISMNLSVNDIITKIENYKPDYSCLNIFTTNYRIVKNIIEKTKTSTYWIIGGISSKSLYKEIFKWKTSNPIDIVYGDGELITKAIIGSTLEEAPIEEEANKRFYIINSKSKYYCNNISLENLDRSIYKNEPQTNVFGDKEIAIYTSRGCPYNCAYCVAANSRNSELRPIRRKSKDAILKELKYIKKKYPDVRAIRILDDLFLSNKQNFNNAISIFKKSDFLWRAMCHVKSINLVDDDMLNNLATSGCKELFVGIESGANEILSKIHKTDDINLILSSIKRLIDVGINVKGYFICGFPEETEKNLQETYNLANTLTIYSKAFQAKFRNSTFQFRPYYGTELYDEIIKKRGLACDYVLTEMKVSDSINSNVRDKSFNFDSGNYSLVSDETLQDFINKMNSLNEQ